MLSHASRVRVIPIGFVATGRYPRRWPSVRVGRVGLDAGVGNCRLSAQTNDTLEKPPRISVPFDPLA